jgi:hypothetical protein
MGTANPGGAFEGRDGKVGKLPYCWLRSKGLPEASSGGDCETAEDGTEPGPDRLPD